MVLHVLVVKFTRTLPKAAKFINENILKKNMKKYMQFCNTGQ